MKEHDLKTWPEYFQPIMNDLKRFEVRKNDRDFQVGDLLILREWDVCRQYTGRVIRATIIYILEGGRFGIQEGYVCMSFQVVEVTLPL